MGSGVTPHGLRGYPADYGPFVDAAALDAILVNQQTGYPAGTMLSFKWLGETANHQAAWKTKYVTAGDTSQATHIVDNVDTPEIAAELRAAYERVAGVAAGAPAIVSKMPSAFTWGSPWTWGGAAALVTVLSLAAWLWSRSRRRS